MRLSQSRLQGRSRRRRSGVDISDTRREDGTYLSGGPKGCVGERTEVHEGQRTLEDDGRVDVMWPTYNPKGPRSDPNLVNPTIRNLNVNGDIPSQGSRLIQRQ